MKQLMKLNELAQYFGVTRQTVYTWINKLNLPHTSTPGGSKRFDLEEVIEWNNNREK